MKKFLPYLLLLIGAYLVYAFVASDPYFVHQKLGNDYFVTQTSAGDRAIGKDIKADMLTYVIYGHVINFKNGNRFLLASRVPRDSLNESMKNSLLVGKTWEEKDSLLTDNPFKVYYIIDKEQQMEYGPYNFNIFQQQCEKMKVPESERLN